jgi:uncharacterized protein
VILTDVNLLVYAYRVDSPNHSVASAWLNGVLSSSVEFALLDVVLGGVVRIVTNPKIFAPPAPAVQAMEFVEAIIAAPLSRWVSSSTATWTALRTLVDSDAGLRGNHVPDALLAATAIAHGARLATTDHGFARYKDLDWFNPLGQ